MKIEISTPIQYKFKIGDRVTRLKDIFDKNSPLLHGSVIKVYSMTGLRIPSDGIDLGFYEQVFDVNWDSGGFGQGFLPHGLEPEGLLIK